MLTPSKKRVKRNQTKYIKEWEELPELQAWLAPSRRVPGKAYCRVCDKDLEFKKGGVFDLKRHSATSVHIRIARDREQQMSLRQAFEPRVPSAV